MILILGLIISGEKLKAPKKTSKQFKKISKKVNLDSRNPVDSQTSMMKINGMIMKMI